MIVRRTIPPAAAPISLSDLLYGFLGIMNGKAIGRLEGDIKEYFGVEYPFFVSSGKAALFIILIALNRMSGKRKVIIPAYTCYSVPSAVHMAGLEIVLCDVKRETLDFDFSRLKMLLDQDTLCVVPTHLFGVPSDIERVRELCGDSIFIVEDAAQAMGARNRKGKLGTLGDVSFFSLGRGKNITCGNGGIILTSSRDIAESIRRQVDVLEDVSMVDYLKQVVEVIFLILFLHPNLFWFPKGLPFLKLGETEFHRKFPVKKFTAFQAGLLRGWRTKLEMFNRRRAEVSDYYIGVLPPEYRTPFHKDGSPFNRFPFCLDDRSQKDALCKRGSMAGISPMYPGPIHKIRELAGTFGDSDFEGADDLSDTLVTLPTHVLLQRNDKRIIGDMVKEAFRQSGNGGTMMRRRAECH